MLNLVKITGFSASLTIPFSSFEVPFVSTLEFVGGVCLSARSVYAAVALLLTCNMFVVYWTVGREALSAIFSDPGKFYTAEPYTFLFVSLMVLIFGAGWFAVDTPVAKRLKAVEQ